MTKMGNGLRSKRYDVLEAIHVEGNQERTVLNAVTERKDGDKCQSLKMLRDSA